MQQLGHDQPDPVDLFIDQADFLPHRFGVRTEHIPEHIQVALDHGDGIVDFMGDPCRQLSDRSQFFRHHQSPLGLAQVSIGLFQRLGPLQHLGIQFIRPALQFLVALL
ncbi:hypothetical protein D3C84_1111970 [compost metagenome]